MCTGLTFTSMSPTFWDDRIIGRPTIDGNMWAGKFEPAYPHFTNCKKIFLDKFSTKRKHLLDRWTYPCSIVTYDDFLARRIHRGWGQLKKLLVCKISKMAEYNFLLQLSEITWLNKQPLLLGQPRPGVFWSFQEEIKISTQINYYPKLEKIHK